GTNAHVIVEEAPQAEAQAEAGGREVPVPGVVVPWVVSGRSAGALAAQAGRLAEYAESRPELDVVDVGWSLASARSVLEHRAVVLGAGGDRGELLAGLRALAAGTPSASVVSGVSGVAQAQARAVFVFPGQGSQWRGMAVGLLDSSPVFARSIEECERALAPFVDWSLSEVLRGGGAVAERWEQVDVLQPVLFAVMVSLAGVWRSMGVEPAAVLGHSQGEIAAACVAGGLSLGDAARVVALRSRALRRLSGLGGMVSVVAGRAWVEQVVERWPDRVGVAAVNGPGSTVVSGDVPALEELLALCEAEGVRARRVPVDYASHSAHVEQIREELLRELAVVEPVVSRVPLCSTVTGDWLSTEGLDAEYWVRNLRQPVEFETAT
ncbi:acyltransferase domain-containing protein, partial [Streptomyces sp. NPDC055506]